MTTIRLDPVTRIEGHLAVEVEVESVGGVQQVVDARSSGTSFRGFENILINRDPRDAVHYTQRICGVCPTSHAMAAAMTLEQAFGVVAPANGRILRNLVLGADHLQSHILHLYHLAALDYIDTAGVLDLAPWTPRYTSADMISDPAQVSALVGHYVQALAMRRKAHQMGAIFGAKLPCTATFVVGGCTETVTAEKIASFRALLTELRGFIDNVMIPDTAALAATFPEYYRLGAGWRNLLSYGVFDLDTAGKSRLLARGRFTDGQFLSVNTSSVTEYVKYSWYADGGGKHPGNGVTEPLVGKAGAYSWDKAPRYLDKPHEAGPLARMYINGDYREGISVMDRLAARTLETKKVADAMDDWLNQLVVGGPTYNHRPVPTTSVGVGLTEAPRGALGHWMQIANSKISRYQVITPTAWNASPKDDFEQLGPIEKALIGTPVADPAQPIELLRVIHSFDPCLACTVHLVRPR